MGFVFSKHMRDSLTAQQDFMLMNSRLQLERQLPMQNEMRERQTAMQIAWAQEVLQYFGTFFGLAAVGLTAACFHSNLTQSVLHPTAFPCNAVKTACFGNCLRKSLNREAENVLDTQGVLLQLPKGPFAYEDLEKIRRSQRKFFREK
ncbi:LOW QUALITY PROTEIN: plasminogen receptor (KT) [Dryobates pubescens]|uniref:LOW QUALITY PROTEIN: plasminogen receptor (KT) n=1 Tax=Dryobates pubescens TaxID=118200 RepID=UPI0023B8F509|nr:LOW QUALITY PROTEIN: plasminogen receptor (KT) [Dryobates pubescens]